MRSTLLPALLAWFFCAGALAQHEAAGPVISVGYYEFPPYTWTDENGQQEQTLVVLR